MRYIDSIFDSDFIGLSLEDCLKKINEVIRREFPTQPGFLSQFTPAGDMCAFTAHHYEEEMRIELLRRACELLFPNRIEIAQEYISRLFLRTIHEDKHEFEKTLDSMKKFINHYYPESVELASYYAMGLKFYLGKQNPSEHEETLIKLGQLKAKFGDNSYVAQMYREAITISQEIAGEGKNHIDDYDNRQNDFLEESHIITTKGDRTMLSAVAEKAFADLEVLYADNDLRLDTDPEFIMLFQALCDYYTAFNEKQDLLAFLPIRSNIGKVFTLYPMNKTYYAIIWDMEYWELFETFCEFLLFLTYGQIDILNYLFENVAEFVRESIVAKLYSFISKKYEKTNTNFSRWCKDIEKEKTKGNLHFDDSRLRMPGEYIWFGKTYVMLHEFEHIYKELGLEEDIREIDNKGFDQLLRRVLFHIENSLADGEEIHGYSKTEYKERLGRIIKNDLVWVQLREELFNDWKAFFELVSFQMEYAGKGKEEAIHNACVGEKVYNMFRTWLYIPIRYAEEGLHYKGKGLSSEECAKRIYDDLHEYEDEIEFRQVLNQLLVEEYMKEFTTIENCQETVSHARKLIKTYQVYIRPSLIQFQQEFLYLYSA